MVNVQFNSKRWSEHRPFGQKFLSHANFLCIISAAAFLASFFELDWPVVCCCRQTQSTANKRKCGGPKIRSLMYIGIAWRSLTAASCNKLMKLIQLGGVIGPEETVAALGKSLPVISLYIFVAATCFASFLLLPRPSHDKVSISEEIYTDLKTKCNSFLVFKENLRPW